MTRLRALVIVFALVMWAATLARVDLRTESLVRDLGYGAITALLVPAGLLAQLRRPEAAVAGLQQVGACAVAYAIAGVAADPNYLVLAAVVAAGLVLVLLVHPVGGTFFAVPDASSSLLAVLAMLTAGPLALYAAKAADRGWGGLTAMAIAIALVALLAALRTTGWRVPAYSAAAAAAAWGAGNLLFPDEIGSEGRGWGLLALAWALAFAATAARLR